VHDADDRNATVASARRGDPQAWRTLVQNYHAVLLHIGQQCGLSPDDAADVAQTTWTVCVEKLNQLADDTAFLGWMMTICRREAYRVAAQARRCEPHDLDTYPFAALHRAHGAGEDVASEVSRRDELARLSSAIDDLPPRQRTVLRALARHDDADYATTARNLGVPIGSLGPTRARAVKRLRADPRLALAG
jgi:RNA polymerase sigma factor (sigma-70 family)